MLWAHQPWLLQATGHAALGWMDLWSPVQLTGACAGLPILRLDSQSSINLVERDPVWSNLFSRTLDLFLLNVTCLGVSLILFLDRMGYFKKSTKTDGQTLQQRLFCLWVACSVLTQGSQPTLSPHPKPSSITGTREFDASPELFREWWALHRSPVRSLSLDG